MSISLKFLPRLLWIHTPRTQELMSVRSFVHLTKRDMLLVRTARPPMNLYLNDVVARSSSISTSKIDAIQRQNSRPFSSRRRLPVGLSPDPKSGSDLHLMNFPQIIWPSFIYTIKNWILARVIIQPYMDRDFSLDTFAAGAKQAMLCMSSLLSQGNFEQMQGLVTEDALKEIKENHAKLSMEQRHMIGIKESDLYFSFPYQVGIMLEDSAGASQRRFVEITMCFHCLMGSEEIRKLDPAVSELYKYKDKLVVCNSRFIKEFTKGAESDWTINVINYFRPAS